MINSILKLSAVFAATAVLTACAYPTVEGDFGESVRHAMRIQAVATGPVDTTPVTSGDGQRISNVLEALRNDVSRGDGSQQPANAQLGSGTQQSQ